MSEQTIQQVKEVAKICISEGQQFRILVIGQRGNTIDRLEGAGPESLENALKFAKQIKACFQGAKIDVRIRSKANTPPVQNKLLSSYTEAELVEIKKHIDEAIFKKRFT